VKLFGVVPLTWAAPLTATVAFADSVMLATSESKLVPLGASTTIVLAASLIVPTTAGLVNEYAVIALALLTVMHVPATAIVAALPDGGATVTFPPKVPPTVDKNRT
jgi:hypothetical protein